VLAISEAAVRVAFVNFYKGTPRAPLAAIWRILAGEYVVIPRRQLVNFLLRRSIALSKLYAKNNNCVSIYVSQAT